MSSILPNLEYIQYIEPHLSLKIYEFLLKRNPSNEDIQSQYKIIFSKTRDYSKQKDQNLKSDEEISLSKSEMTKSIEEMESNLHGFLNLIDNCQKINDYDLNSFSLGKKIVIYIKEYNNI